MNYSFFLNNIEFFIFVICLTIILIINKKNLELSGSFPFVYMLLYKTKTGLSFMKKFSKKYSRFVKYFSYTSIVVGIIGTFLSFSFMIYQLIFIVKKGITSGGGFVLPIKTSSSVPIFYVPFWYWIIAISTLVVVHEFAHGIVSERWKVKIKSSGFAFMAILLPIIPAAFVEPDEKSLKSKSWWKKIAVYGAGSLSNFCFGIIFLLILVFCLNPLTSSISSFDGLAFTSVMNQSSLNRYNISSGIIYGINDHFGIENITKELTNLSSKSYVKLYLKDVSYKNGSKSSQNLTLSIKPFTLKEYGNRSMIGISGIHSNLKFKKHFNYLGDLLLKLAKLLYWLIILNIGIGIMNLLPIWITDGGQILSILLSLKFDLKKSKKIFNYISIVVLIVIIFTIWPKWLLKIINFL